MQVASKRYEGDMMNESVVNFGIMLRMIRTRDRETRS